VVVAVGGRWLLDQLVLEIQRCTITLSRTERAKERRIAFQTMCEILVMKNNANDLRRPPQFTLIVQIKLMDGDVVN
jgi:hypothetical protein